MASSGIDYRIIMDTNGLPERLSGFAMGLNSHINSWLHNTSYLVKEEMTFNAPGGVASTIGQGLKNNIGIDINVAERTAEIKPNSNVSSYADAVETGSRPHRPPAGPDSALAQWCEMKGLNVWAVAKSIERKGTRPHPYIEPTYQSTKEPVARMFSEGVRRYLREGGL